MECFRGCFGLTRLGKTCWRPPWLVDILKHIFEGRILESWRPVLVDKRWNFTKQTTLLQCMLRFFSQICLGHMFQEAWPRCPLPLGKGLDAASEQFAEAGAKVIPSRGAFTRGDQQSVVKTLWLRRRLNCIDEQSHLQISGHFARSGSQSWPELGLWVHWGARKNSFQAGCCFKQLLQLFWRTRPPEAWRGDGQWSIKGQSFSGLQLNATEPLEQNSGRGGQIENKDRTSIAPSEKHLGTKPCTPPWTAPASWKRP